MTKRNLLLLIFILATIIIALFIYFYQIPVVKKNVKIDETKIEEKSFSSTHHGIEFISSIGDENIFATQFHPEKSGEAGLKFFDNFLKWNP